MNGVLVIDKPEGWTSHDVVARIRRIFNTKRVGHTGTLDPFATGVLVLLVGYATRLAQFLDKDEKVYDANIRLGYETETGDHTGAPRSSPIIEVGGISAASIEQALSGFRGTIEQTPPMYSAKKVKGKKLYELARRGEEIDREPITVEIRELGLGGPLTRQPDGTIDFGVRITCSAGTYIRTLAEDIGRALGTGAHLSALRRTRAGKFDLRSALTLDQIESLADPSDPLISVERALDHLPLLNLPGDRVRRTRDGLGTRTEDPELSEGTPVRMCDESGSLIAIGEFSATEKIVRPKVVLR
jgi:tRNA pseudouridine55 synthase